MASGAARQASLQPLRWRLRLPGQRLQLPNLRLSGPALRPEPSGDRSPAVSPVRPVVPRGEAGRVLVSVTCCPSGLLVVGSGRRGMPPGLVAGKVSRCRAAHARCPVLAVPPPALADGAARRARLSGDVVRARAAIAPLRQPRGDHLGEADRISPLRAGISRAITDG
jgi:hypothetical protein